MPNFNGNRDDDVLRVNALEAREIRLVDESGRERASLTCSGGTSGQEGYVVVQLNDGNGLPRIELQVDDQGCSIRLNTPDDARGVSLQVADGIGTGIGVNDQKGDPRIRIGISHPESADPRGCHPEVTMIDDGIQRSWTVDS